METKNNPNQFSQSQENPISKGSNTIHSLRIEGATQTIQTIFDPKVVQQYSEMVSDAPERILSIFEKNNHHEYELRVKPFRVIQRRDWMGFFLVLSILLVSVYFAYLERFWFSGTTLIVFISLIIRSFLPTKDK